MSTPMKTGSSQHGSAVAVGGRTSTPTAAAANAGTPPVSTPFSVATPAFSPPPLGSGSGGAHHRSSPVAFKKSPVAHHGGGGGGGGGGSHGAIAGGGAGQQQQSGANVAATNGGVGGGAPVNFDSPLALGALGGLDLGLDGVGGLGTLHAAGVGGAVQPAEDEKLKRLDTVIDIISTYKGRVSGVGLERLVTQLGLDSLWENESGGKKSNTLIVAGKYMALDIQLEDNTVQKVSCTFESSSDLVRAHEHKISEILMNDLRLRPNELPLCRTLDRFAVNLERLALLDGLSERDSLDCFEAVAGIHESLERLHAWDMGKLRQDPSLAGASESVLLNTALATRHGHPGMHTRGRVGLSLDYWKDRWMEPPQPQSGPDVESWAKENEATWAILVGCARAGEYQRPIRVSDNWLAPNVEVADPTSADLLSVSAADRSTGPMLDWQEPEERVISPKGDKMGNGSGLDGMDADDPLAVPKLPEVVFTATFDPPVIVPINVWANIHSLVDATSDFQTVTFDNLLFPVSPGSAYNPSEMTRTIEHTREVRVFSSDGKKATKVHKNTLFIFKPVYGRSLAQLPFAHPRQLIAMLPYLRQCAFLATLLKRSFGKKSDEAKAPEGKSQAAARANGMVDEPVDLEVKPLSEDFTGFLDSSLGGSHDGSDARGKSKTARRLPGETDASGSGDALRIDVTLMAHPTPRLEVVFPFRRRTANILLEVALDGRLLVVSQNVVLPEPGTAGQSAVLGGAAASRAALASGGGSGGAAAVDEEMDEPGSSSKGKGKLVSPKKLAELLESCMDLDMWCEWIKTRLE